MGREGRKGEGSREKGEKGEGRREGELESITERP